MNPPRSCYAFIAGTGKNGKRTHPAAGRSGLGERSGLRVMHLCLLDVAVALDRRVCACGFFSMGGFCVGSSQGEAHAGEPACHWNRGGSDGLHAGGSIHGFFLFFLLVERLSWLD